MSGLVKLISGFMVSAFTFVACLLVYLIFFINSSYPIYLLVIACVIIIGIGIYLHGKLFDYFMKFYSESEIFNYDVDDIEDEELLDEESDDLDSTIEVQDTPINEDNDSL